MPRPLEQDEFDGPSYAQRPVLAAPGGSTTVSTNLTDKRRDMLALVQKWMPTSLNYPRVPPGEAEDLLKKSGWNKSKGEASKKVSDNNKKTGSKDPVATSCGDVLAAMLVLWKSEFIGAFGIRDVDSKNKPPGAKGRGYYVEADGIKVPKPGDIIVLRAGVGKSSAGSVGHVGILVEASATVWRTADGGGGELPDQTAAITDRRVKYDANNIPILISPTDGKEKLLDGWIDLDLIPRGA